ncbi:MAG: cob(I)yrinic acid a,c-diamide adenosyltransferase [bacterium]
MKIYTKTGDRGETSLLRGGRVAKHHPRVEAYGTFDELNSWIGYARSITDDSELEAVLERIQNHVHLLCSDVAADSSLSEEGAKIPRLQQEHVTALEREIDRLDQILPPLTHFILPGGSQPGAALHIARTICRRGERRLTELIETGGAVNEHSLIFVNRLSDLLFTLARWANHRAGKPETPWHGQEYI